MCELALDISKKEYFLNTEEYLEKLFKKAYVKLKLQKFEYNSNLIIYSEINLDERIEYIYDIIKELEIHIVICNFNDIYEKITEYIIKNGFYKGFIMNDKVINIIENITFAMIDMCDN